MAWDGCWTLFALPPVAAAEREHIRTDLALLGFGQLAGGLLVHPAPLTGEVAAHLEQLGIADSVVAMHAGAVAGLSDAGIARTAWNLDDLEARYRRFLKLFAPLATASAGGRELPADAAFVVRILLIHEYRRIHLRDPMLPASMLPKDWLGRQAHDTCRSLYARTFKAAEHYLTATLRNAQGPLPPPAPEVLQRFGGLRLR
jgi:phenylacetic acid degradation operon negative regulatory protein